MKTRPVLQEQGTRFAQEIEAVRGSAQEPIRLQLFDLVREHGAELSNVFYEALFADPESAALVDHEIVSRRLHASMQRWLHQLFDPLISPADLYATQVHTGEVHARIGVPLPLVNRSMRTLCRSICEMLPRIPLDRLGLLAAAQYVHDMFTLAVDGMNSAFAYNSNRLARSEEAYRLFFLGQDMKAERERRRSELLEWVHRILERYYWQPTDSLGQEEDAPFSLWLHHKAAMLFEGSAEVELIRADIERVERELLPRLARVRDSQADARAVVGEINRRIDRVKELLGTMFDRYLAVEDGRDSVTSLLNRRYFPAIARREIEVATSGGPAFAVLMIDIDGFRAAIESLGHDSGNVMLAQVATVLQEHLRAGDFVFRLGDDEFLVLLVECDAAAAMRVAEALRRRIETQRFGSLDSAQRAVQITISAGLAPFDGHPDYQRLLDRASDALRRCKDTGRNRILLAD